MLLSAFASFGFLGPHSVKFLPRGFMVLTLTLEDDYLKFWSKGEVIIGTVSIRFSKWISEFKFEEESSIVPVWVRLVDLPLHLYDKKCLYLIAKILGNPVKVDEVTANGSRGSFARVCIEIDVLNPRQDHIWVGWGSHSQDVKVIYEKVPHFCTACKLLGHSIEFCSRHGSSRPRRSPHIVTASPVEVPAIVQQVIPTSCIPSTVVGNSVLPVQTQGSSPAQVLHSLPLPERKRPTTRRSFKKHVTKLSSSYDRPP